MKTGKVKVRGKRQSPESGDLSRRSLAERYAQLYIIASYMGAAAYFALTDNSRHWMFAVVVPVTFPRALGCLLGYYQPIPHPIQILLEYGAYLCCAMVGIWTKRRLVHTLFGILLILNIGGCVAAGVQERWSGQPPKQKPPGDGKSGRLIFRPENRRSEDVLALLHSLSIPGPARLRTEK